MDAQNVKVTVDADFQIRILDAESFQQTSELSTESVEFVSKIQEFNTTVHQLVEVLDTQARKIEHWKLKAIGQRNRVDHEEENRSRLQNAKRALIAERRAELERYVKQSNALKKVEQDQLALAERLSAAES